MLRDEEIEAIARMIADRIRPERIVVFGSYAKGRASPRSDLDLLIVTDTPLPPARRADDVRPLVAGRAVHVDIHVVTPEEVAEIGAEDGSFIASAIETGREVYRRSSDTPSGSTAVTFRGGQGA